MRLVLLFLALLPISVEAQDYYWTMVPEKEYHQSAVEVRMPSRMGTGVIVRISGEPDADGGRLGRILTCLHVGIYDNNTGTLAITFRNGEVSKGKLLRWNAEEDLCVIEAIIPKGYTAAEFADTACLPGDCLEAVGLGGGLKITSNAVRRFSFTAGRLTDPTAILCDEVVVPGDSGGPVFRDGKLIGIISAGYRNEEVTNLISPFPIRGYWGAVVVPTELGKDLCLLD